MKYNQVELKDLKTSAECDEMVEKIENDYRNYQGGLERWHSGYETKLLTSAKKKVEAIQKRASRLHEKYCKENGIED